jgi:hypothetical protein
MSASSAPSAPSSSAPGPLLQAFHDLAAVDQRARVAAAGAIVRHLREAQRSFEAAGAKVGTLPPAAAGVARPSCGDLQYAMTRLVRGLSSGRGGARQGFALALSEVLAAFRAHVPTREAVARVLGETREAKGGLRTGSTGGSNAPGMTSKAELREALLGRVFGLLAVAKAGRFAGAEAEAEEGAGAAAAIAVTELLAAANKKPWLAAAAVEGVAGIVSLVSAGLWTGHLSKVVEARIGMATGGGGGGGGVEGWTAEQAVLAFAVEAAHAKWSAAGAAPAGKGAAVPLPESVKRLRAALASASSASAAGAAAPRHPLLTAALDATKTHPALHPFWQRLLQRGVSAAAKPPAHAPHDAEVAPVNVESLALWWGPLVDRGLLAAGGKERRATAVSLLTNVAPAACITPAGADAVLSPAVVRLLVQELPNRTALLHGAATAALAAVTEAARTSTPAAAAALAALASRGHPGFDTVTHTRFASTLLTVLGEEDVHAHVRTLVRHFVAPGDLRGAAGAGAASGAAPADDDDDVLDDSHGGVDFTAAELAKKQQRKGGNKGGAGGASSSSSSSAADGGGDDDEADTEGSLSAADLRRLQTVAALSAAIRNPSLTALRQPKLLAAVLAVLSFHSFASVSGSAADAAAIAALAGKLRIDSLLVGADASALLVATPALGDFARAELRTRIATLVKELVGQQATEATTSGPAPGAGAGASAAAPSGAAAAAAAQGRGQDRSLASANLAFTLLAGVNGVYDAAASVAGVTVFPPVKDLEALPGDDARGMDDDDEEEGGDDSDSDEEDGHAHAHHAAPRLTPAAARKYALSAASALHAVAKSLVASGGGAASAEAARQAASYAALLSQVALAIVSDVRSAGELAGAAGDLVGCAGHLAAVGQAQAGSAAAAAAPAAPLSKKERRASEGGAGSGAAVAKAVAQLGEAVAAVKASSMDSDDEEEDGASATAGSGLTRHDRLVFIDALLAILANASAPLRDAVKAAARHVLSGITADALQPILDLLAASFGTEGSAGRGGGGDDDDDDEDDEDGEGAGAALENDDDEASITLSVGSDDELSVLIGGDGGKAKKSAKRRSKAGGGDAQRAKRTRNDDGADKAGDEEEDDEEEDAASKSSSEDEDATPEQRRAHKLAEMERYDRMLEHMLRLRKEQKATGKETKKRGLHFRFRALDLLEVAIVNLAAGSGSAEAGTAAAAGGAAASASSYASPELLHLLHPLLACMRQIAARVRAKETAGNADAAADGASLLSRLVALLGRATKARVPALVGIAQASTSSAGGVAAAYAAAKVTPESVSALFERVCELAASAPSPHIVDACAAVANTLVRALRPAGGEGGGGSGAGTTGGLAPQPAPAAVDRLVASYAGAYEAYLTERHPKVTAAFFRNAWTSLPVVAVRLMPHAARTVAAGRVPKAFRLAETFQTLAAAVKACAAPHAAALVCEAAAAAPAKGGSAKKQQARAAGAGADAGSARTVGQALAAAVPALCGAVESVVAAFNGAAGDKGKAPLHAKQLREPLELVRTLLRLGLVEGGAAEGALAAISRLAATVPSDNARKAAEGVLRAAGKPIPEREEPPAAVEGAEGEGEGVKEGGAFAEMEDEEEEEDEEEDEEAAPAPKPKAKGKAKVQGGGGKGPEAGAKKGKKQKRKGEQQ